MGHADTPVNVYKVQSFLCPCPQAAFVIGLDRLDKFSAKKASFCGAPEASVRCGPERAIRRQAEVCDIVVRQGKCIGRIGQIFGNQTRVFINDVKSCLCGAVDQIADGIFNKPASKAGTQENVGVYLRGWIKERAQPLRRGGLTGLSVPFIQADSLPCHYPEPTVTAFQEVHDPV